MPLVRISLSHDVSDDQLSAISDAVHAALVQKFNVPAADRFQVVTRHPAAELICTPEYLGIKHGARIAFVQITANEGRTVEMKKDLYGAIASSIAEVGGIAAADVIINLVEVKKENWSFGNGIAQYATPQ
jgi:phenylpyruvate tautomerase PptA (4-oxalocrotonate tautomerase family)